MSSVEGFRSRKPAWVRLSRAPWTPQIKSWAMVGSGLWRSIPYSTKYFDLPTARSPWLNDSRAEPKSLPTYVPASRCKWSTTTCDWLQLASNHNKYDQQRHTWSDWSFMLWSRMSVTVPPNDMFHQNAERSPRNSILVAFIPGRWEYKYCTTLLAVDRKITWRTPPLRLNSWKSTPSSQSHRVLTFWSYFTSLWLLFSPI